MIDYETLVQDDRIHASLHTDPQVFDDEMERIFHRGWVLVAHESEATIRSSGIRNDAGPMPASAIHARTAPWLLLGRGLNRETVDTLGRTVSHVTDETTNRGFCRHFRTVMTET